jgi:predicted transcriptional regulator of viral defense system
MNIDKIALLLDDNEIDIFEINSLSVHIGEKTGQLQRKIETLVKRGLLSRIEKGKYCKHNFRNQYVIANYLAPEGAVAYWSALNLHGLTTQFPNTVFVQTPKLKRNKTVFGVNYQFVKVKPSKAVCFEQSGYGNHTFSLTTIEKTMVDCFDLPDYNGGYSELILALTKAKLNNKKLIEAAKAVDNIAVIKRLGYLIEVLQKEGMSVFLKYALDCVNRMYNVNILDPSLNDKGVFNNKWNLRINISEADIVAMSKILY